MYVKMIVFVLVYYNAMFISYLNDVQYDCLVVAEDKKWKQKNLKILNWNIMQQRFDIIKKNR